MIRYALPLTLIAGPVLAHGVHAPVSPAWHGAAHLTPYVVFALLAVAGVAALRDVRRRMVREDRERRARR